MEEEAIAAVAQDVRRFLRNDGASGARRMATTALRARDRSAPKRGRMGCNSCNTN